MIVPGREFTDVDGIIWTQLEDGWWAGECGCFQPGLLAIMAAHPNKAPGPLEAHRRLGKETTK